MGGRVRVAQGRPSAHRPHQGRVPGADGGRAGVSESPRHRHAAAGRAGHHDRYASGHATLVALRHVQLGRAVRQRASRQARPDADRGLALCPSSGRSGSVRIIARGSHHRGARGLSRPPRAGAQGQRESTDASASRQGVDLQRGLGTLLRGADVRAGLPQGRRCAPHAAAESAVACRARHHRRRACTPGR